MHQHQQLQQPLQSQQQPHHTHQQHPSQSGWPPSHQAPPKVAQPVPAQSAWGAQHGGVQAKPAVSSPHPPQQHHTWPTSGPSQQPHPLSLRDSRGSSVYDSQSPTAGMPHPHHQHHNSLGGGRYAPGPGPQDAVRRSDQQQQPMPQQAPGQPPYARYTNTPGPGPTQQGRDPVRSYTPGFDHRGPPPPGPPGHPPPQAQQPPPQQTPQQQYVTQQQQQRQEEVLREQQQMREAQMREMQGRGDLRDQTGNGGGGILGRQLRPGPEGGPQPPPVSVAGQVGVGPGPGPGLYERDGRRY
jgi:hypothetical protein